MFCASISLLGCFFSICVATAAFFVASSFVAAPPLGERGLAPLGGGLSGRDAAHGGGATGAEAFQRSAMLFRRALEPGKEVSAPDFLAGVEALVPVLQALGTTVYVSFKKDVVGNVATLRENIRLQEASPAACPEAQADSDDDASHDDRAAPAPAPATTSSFWRRRRRGSAVAVAPPHSSKATKPSAPSAPAAVANGARGPAAPSSLLALASVEFAAGPSVYNTPKSSAVALVWLKRILEFLVGIFKEISDAAAEAEREASNANTNANAAALDSGELARRAYTRTLEQHHHPILRSVVRRVLKLLPSCADLVGRLGYANEALEEANAAAAAAAAAESTATATATRGGAAGSRRQRHWSQQGGGADDSATDGGGVRPAAAAAAAPMAAPSAAPPKAMRRDLELWVTAAAPCLDRLDEFFEVHDTGHLL